MAKFKLADKFGYVSPFDEPPFNKEWQEKRERKTLNSEERFSELIASKLGKAVTVSTVKRPKGKEVIRIKYKAVLVDSSGSLSHSQMNKLISMTTSALEFIFKGESDKRVWSLNADIQALESKMTVDSILDTKNNPPQTGIILLQKNLTSQGVALDGFIAQVKADASDIVHTIVHEIGHTMGLPHVWETVVTNSEIETLKKESLDNLTKLFKPTRPKYDLVKDDNELMENLMAPGSFPDRFQGYKILESQILHIKRDYDENKLNRLDVAGDSDAWGIYETDIPAYKFDPYYVSKNPFSGEFTILQKLIPIRPQ